MAQAYATKLEVRECIQVRLGIIRVASKKCDRKTWEGVTFDPGQELAQNSPKRRWTAFRPSSARDYGTPRFDHLQKFYHHVGTGLRSKHIIFTR